MSNISTPLTNSHDTITLAEYAEKAYLEYAMSVIKGRAIPSISDGQKPVQRRILFSMYEMGLSNQAKPVKSARVVGDVIGKYHPHGDTSAYDAMVRMAQGFTLRYPLVDGVGNYGSRDGDGAAAMRYTEARLMPISELLLAEINLGTVDFKPNYDGVNQEPIDLPSRLPIILLNGASGIAVGLATEIPSHNLKEVAQATVALIKNPNLSTKDLMQYIMGPDFATGGHIINSSEELLNIYTTGKGSVRVRAKYSVEKLARGQWRIIVNEIPQTTSTQKILAQIESQTNPKPKGGKKQLTQEQNNTKSLILSILDRVRDESDGEQPIRLVFEPKYSRQDPKEFINTLMAQTDLELNIPINLIMIGLDGRPQQKSLKNILEEWIIFRKTCVTRRLQHRLTQVEKRMHILEGRMTVFVHIDEVITIIRESNDPKQELISHFKLTQIQAEDILEIRLRQLAKLEWLKLENELNKLKEEAQELMYLLNNEDAKKKLIIKEIQSDSKKFGDERRTKIEETERSLLNQTTADEPITLILSKEGWMRSRVGHHLDLSTTTFKEKDELQQILEARTISPITLLDTTGQSYTIDASQIPSGRGDGIPIATLIDINPKAKIIGMLTGEPEQKVLLTSSDGYGFITNLKHMMTKMRTGKNIITVTKNHQALPPILLNHDDLKNAILIAVSNETRLIAFHLNEIKFLNKGRGLQIMSLSTHYRLQHVMVTTQEKYHLHIRNQKNTSIETYHISDILTNRGKKGKAYKSTNPIIGIS
ncbi:MAG: DNA topoisomerase IV subunit A [Neisseriaceae bacterium]|nr:MAG: DNA topoisomerase IV subunit A [Neisseriaceae bacterium]